MFTSGKMTFLASLITVIITVGIACAATFYLFPDSEILITLSLILAIVVSTVICKRICNHSEYGVFHLLDEKCDPEAYLKNYEQYYGKVHPNALLLEKRGEALNKATALIALGNMDEARRMMNYIDPLKIKDGYVQQFLYYNNLAAIAASECDVEKIGYCLRILERGGFEEVISENVEFSVKFYNAKLLSMKGDLTQSRDAFGKLLSLPASTMLKLNILYNIALIDIELNNNKTAKEYLSVVANEGNKLFIAQDARQKLAGLEQLQLAANDSIQP